MEEVKRKPGRPNKLMQPVNRTLLFDADTNRFLASLPNASEFVRQAIAEKRARMNTLEEFTNEYQ